MDDRLIPISEIAEKKMLPLNPSHTTIERKCRKGELSAVNGGMGKARRWFMYESDIKKINKDWEKQVKKK